MTDLELYNSAKEAYYNGNPIMEDFEFDALEEKLGLSNKSYIGTRHNPSYTVKHPFIMGSLSKVQIKESKDHTIDWPNYLNEINKYIHKTVKDTDLIITPKYDGCSFEAVIDDDGIITSISSRGDGEYGKDLYMHLANKVLPNVQAISSQYIGTYVMRGEVLIDKRIFEEKYSEFVNPRSFVSGILNRDFDNTDSEFMNMLNDLSIVIYDFKLYDSESMEWIDTDFFKYDYPDKPKMFFKNIFIEDSEALCNLYDRFATYRQNVCYFALDGIVIKPVDNNRINNLTEHRPSDCVAIKFIPQLQETTVRSIEWSTKKTDELNPVIIVDPVIMDGKTITRASGHNYGYLIDNKVSVGTKVILSLAGDIIPFIYKITDTTEFDSSKLDLPTDINTVIDGCHLRKVMTDEERNKQRFITSVSQLNIPGIGPSAAEDIYQYMVSSCEGNDFFDIAAKEVPSNILLITGSDIECALGGKSGKAAKKAFEEVLRNITLKDIILSLGYTFCGHRVSEQIQNYLIGKSYNFESMASEGYDWIFDVESDKYNRFKYILDKLNMSIDDFKTVANARIENSLEQIPIIMTGEPNDYETKQDFLNHHPEYRNTTSWKEVQIVFTNSLDSNTGKMKKAKEKNIEIRLY